MVLLRGQSDCDSHWSACTHSAGGTLGTEGCDNQGSDPLFSGPPRVSAGPSAFPPCFFSLSAWPLTTPLWGPPPLPLRC